MPLLTTPASSTNWYDDLAAQLGGNEPPPVYSPTMPSDIDPTHAAWYTGSPRAPYTTQIAKGQKGYRPGPPAAYTTKIAKGQKGYHPAPVPTKYATRLS